MSLQILAQFNTKHERAGCRGKNVYCFARKRTQCTTEGVVRCWVVKGAEYAAGNVILLISVCAEWNKTETALLTDLYREYDPHKSPTNQTISSSRMTVRVEYFMHQHNFVRTIQTEHL